MYKSPSCPKPTKPDPLINNRNKHFPSPPLPSPSLPFTFQLSRRLAWLSSPCWNVVCRGGRPPGSAPGRGSPALGHVAMNTRRKRHMSIIYNHMVRAGGHCTIFIPTSEQSSTLSKQVCVCVIHKRTCANNTRSPVPITHAHLCQ